MDVTVLLFLTSGLFLGWSLGANDAANVFGTAVGTGMVRFVTAAVVCSLFIVLGAVISGTGAAHTLGQLGSINALPGAFAAAFAAALTVYWMTKAGLPVSTSQAIVGAIIGWNWFSNSVTDPQALIKIVGTWIACPLLAAAIAAPLFKLLAALRRRTTIHLLRLDAYTRTALILAGAFGSYSLGANNIANVMGVFVPASPFTQFSVGDLLTVSSVQQLFLLGAIAIAVGVFTYSKRVMFTVGAELMPLSPMSAWVAVTAHSIVLFVFASEGLEHLLASAGLPTIPLVPVSSSQAVVGAVIGIGLLRGGRNIRWRVLGHISVGWIATPAIAACVCFVSLFILQNLFDQRVYSDVWYELTPKVVEHVAKSDVPAESLRPLAGRSFVSAVALRDALREETDLGSAQQTAVIDAAELFHTSFFPIKLAEMPQDDLTDSQVAALNELAGRSFRHRWEVAEALAARSPDWQPLPPLTVNKLANARIRRQLSMILQMFSVN